MRPRSSHEPDQPLEVPYRFVEHDEPEDADAWPWEGRSYPVGHAKEEDFWGWPTKAAEDAFWKERRRIDAAREALGGFGFRSAE